MTTHYTPDFEVPALSEDQRSFLSEISRLGQKVRNTLDWLRRHVDDETSTLSGGYIPRKIDPSDYNESLRQLETLSDISALMHGHLSMEKWGELVDAAVKHADRLWVYGAPRVEDQVN